MASEIDRATSKKFRGRGMRPPDRLRLVAQRLEAGLRETPQRFIPTSFYIERLDQPAKRRFLEFLVAAVYQEAASSLHTPPTILALLARTQDVISRWDGETEAELDLVAEAIVAVEPPRYRRRHIYGHGSITSDRRLLFLRSVVPAARFSGARPAEPEHFEYFKWWRTIAYAMADYDYDHFVMKGAHIAARVHALADWLEEEMARRAIGQA